MGELVNLRRMRKDKARQAREEQAAANRLLHGRTRAERRKDEAEKAQSERHLDAHLLLKNQAQDGDGSAD